MPPFRSFDDFLDKLARKEAVFASESGAAGWVGTPSYAAVFPRVANALKTGEWKESDEKEWRVFG